MSLEMYNPNAAPGEVIYRSPSGYNYTMLLPFEKSYLDNNYRIIKRIDMQNNWLNVVIFSFIYVVVIFTGQYLMKSRQKFNLKPFLITWNLSLSIFSTIGAIRTWPEFIYILKERGVEYSVCTETFSYGATGFWAWVFILSKLFELFDTAFIILRKSPLIFLHWYHHVTVLNYCWYSGTEFSATGRWFAAINYGIHSIMYTYYTIRSIGVKTPHALSIIITSSQLIQMVVGVYVNVKAYQIKQEGRYCDVSDNNIYVALVMYFSYFILFFHFFYNRYIKKVPKVSETNGKSVHHEVNGKHANGTNGKRTNGVNGKHANGVTGKPKSQ